MLRMPAIKGKRFHALKVNILPLHWLCWIAGECNVEYLKLKQNLRRMLGGKCVLLIIFWKLNQDARRRLSFRVKSKNTVKSGVKNNPLFQNSWSESHISLKHTLRLLPKVNPLAREFCPPSQFWNFTSSRSFFLNERRFSCSRRSLNVMKERNSFINHCHPEIKICLLF